MEDLPYYYILVINPYQIESTEILEELVVLLYNGEAEFISEGQIIELNLSADYNDNLRKQISSYDKLVPLYDISFDHIYLINRDNVYPRIYYDDYRFVDKNFYQELISLENPTDSNLDNIRILSHYDLDILYRSYLTLFYKSFILNSYITNCKRPSYSSRMDHIKPYYNINELYFFAYDWNLSNSATLTEDEIENFCKEISNHDIPAETLLDHQMYIYNSNAIGLVKHYSLFGSYYINLYLRNNRCCLREKSNYSDYIQNPYLENQIKIMINLINNSPAFTKNHYVYRFIEKDNYMKHLKIGDIYKDPSFLSTTRNPFYYKELSNYEFGTILVKIKIPPNIKGIGLSIEAYSNFPTEEEIIFPPTSKYKLVNITESKKDINFHGIFKLTVQKKYEFEWIGNDYIGLDKSEIILDMPESYNPVIEDIDFYQIMILDDNIRYMDISDRLKYFRDTYLKNFNNQFASTINGIRYIFNLEAYNSSSVYKQFFYYEVSDGIMITTANPKYGNINILMEIGPEIHINYYFRFSVTDKSMVVDLNQSEWIAWLSQFAYVIGSRTIVIHSYYDLPYKKSDSIEQQQIKSRYIYSRNIYLYLKHKKKLFVFDEIVPDFDYAKLDYLMTYSVNNVIKASDLDELYRILRKTNIQYMGDFYVFIVENHPKLIKLVEEKMELIFEDPDVNPFKNISYRLDAWLYLYNHRIINKIPSDKEFIIKKGSFKKLIGDKKITKFKNRLRTYLVNK